MYFFGLALKLNWPKKQTFGNIVLIKFAHENRELSPA